MYCTILKHFRCRDAVRCLSTSEISTALRPFYFTVHPDLFGQFPTQRTINENSLKQLSLALENLHQRRQIKPVSLAFYLRSRDEKEDRSGKFTLVNIQLKEQNIRHAILSILKTCNLPTTFIDNIKEEAPKEPQNNRFNSAERYSGDIDFSDIENDPIYATIFMKTKARLEPDTLKAYLDKHVNNAHIKFEACRPMRTEVKKLESILMQNLGLKDITWDCGWNIAHYRGCLLAFQALTRHHPESMSYLQGRRLIFANDTGINLEGNVMLNSGEVRHNWLDMIKNMKKHDMVLHRLPAFEKAVSRVLRDIKVVRRKFMPKIMVGQYEHQLRQLITTLSDYQGKSKYPNSWPASLSSHEIVIETEAGPLMLSPTGQFIVPSSCPSFLLVTFITENLVEATKRLQHYHKVKHIEKELHSKTIEELGLVALDKDDSITPDLMIKCCEQLLVNKAVLAPLLEGVMLWVTHYYSVMSDGVLCIPWDWQL